MNDFIGSYRNGKKNGEGRRFYDNGIYEGAWKGDVRWGSGIMWYNNGELYLGEWQNDLYEGAGVLTRGDHMKDFRVRSFFTPGNYVPQQTETAMKEHSRMA